MTAAKTNGKGESKNIETDPKQIAWEGLEFELPPILPLSVSFDLAGVGGPFADVVFLKSVLGYEQMMALREKIDADGAELTPEGSEVLGGLVGDILSAYGFETGESKASAKS